jgi:hypothetical protein
LLQAAPQTVVPSPVKEWLDTHKDFGGLSPKEFGKHLNSQDRGELWEIQSFLKRLPAESRELPLQSVVAGSVPMPVKTWYEALPRKSATAPVHSIISGLTKIKGDLPFATGAPVVPTVVGSSVQSYLEAIPAESKTLPLQSVITHIPKANVPKDVKAFQDAVNANGDAAILPITALLAGISGYPTPSPIYTPMDALIKKKYGGMQPSAVLKSFTETNQNYKDLQDK